MKLTESVGPLRILSPGATFPENSFILGLDSCTSVASTAVLSSSNSPSSSSSIASWSSSTTSRDCSLPEHQEDNQLANDNTMWLSPSHMDSNLQHGSSNEIHECDRVRNTRRHDMSMVLILNSIVKLHMVALTYYILHVSCASFHNCLHMPVYCSHFMHCLYSHRKEMGTY